MGFFPNNYMPLTPKKDAPNSDISSSRVRITASQYNLHDEELRAIEEFLGLPTLGSSYLKSSAQSVLSSSQPSNLISGIQELTDRINTSILDGHAMSSGLTHSGERLIFPQNAIVTYLTTSLAGSSQVLNVSSTDGFPESGILSIPNDVVQGKFNTSTNTWESTVAGGTTTVEYISYDRKTKTSFIGCQRGVYGSAAGPHTGSIEIIRATIAGQSNNKDIPLQLLAPSNPVGFGNFQILDRRYRGWRNRKTYFAPFLNFAGITSTLSFIEEFIRQSPNAVSVYQADDPDTDNFILVSTQADILAQRPDGSYYLKSKNTGLAAANKLTGLEAYNWVSIAVTNNLIKPRQIPSDMTWPDKSIPVFCGILGLNFSLASMATNPIQSPATTTASVLSMSADGTLYAFGNSNRANLDTVMDPIIQYEAFLSHVPMSSLERRTA